MLESVLERMTLDYAKSSDIKWNLTKFLVDRKGNVGEKRDTHEPKGLCQFGAAGGAAIISAFV